MHKFIILEYYAEKDVHTLFAMDACSRILLLGAHIDDGTISTVMFVAATWSVTISPDSIESAVVCP